MPDWKQQLRDAKMMLEEGVIDEEDFQKIKMQAMVWMTDPGAETSVPTTNEQETYVGSYKIITLLGEGGMGVVYRARHKDEREAHKQGGDVAIKLMHSHFSNKQSLIDRFEREAKLGMELNHPGIVRVLDFFVDQGLLAMVMRLVEGQPLSTLIGRVVGPIPWLKAEPLFLQILDVFAYAHSKKVIHRDIKPENIMVTADQTIKVLDFGIAKEMDSNKTKTGTGMGTVGYMAPEQYTNAKQITHKADIYALGMTLYEIVAGRLPWDPDETDFGVMQRKSKGDFPSPREFYPHIPSFVLAAIQKSLVVDVEQRLDDCAFFRKILVEKIELEVEETSPESPPKTQMMNENDTASKRQEKEVVAGQPSSNKKSNGVVMVAGFVGVLLMVAFFVLSGGSNDSSSNEDVASSATQVPRQQNKVPPKPVKVEVSPEEKAWRSYQKRVESRMQSLFPAGPLLQDICDLMRDGNTLAKVHLKKGYGSGYSELCNKVERVSDSDLTKPSFQCSEANNRLELSLCENDELRELDGLMGIVFRDYRNRDPKGSDIRKKYVDKQKQWLKKRNENCSSLLGEDFYECLAQETALRIKHLINH